MYWWSNSVVVGVFAAVTVLLLGTTTTTTISNSSCSGTATSVWVTITWSFAQWLPRLLLHDNLKINTAAWKFWEEHDNLFVSSKSSNETFVEDIPIIYIQDHSINDLLPYIESKYGKHWKKRPLLLKGLWKSDELNMLSSSSTRSRRLSLRGLLLENLTVPYFTDARQVGAITPDGVGRIQDIVSNITDNNAPHKIATQLLLQTYPELIEEVAPISVVTKLFGSYFTPNDIRGSGPMRLFPALTTVPLFIASSHPQRSDTKEKMNENDMQSSLLSQLPAPHTALHCEPIGNVAVQLSGEKLWTLIRPEYSKLVRPMIAPDGRAFFVSSMPDIDTVVSNDANDKIPYYRVITEAGDALWVPTWTWHRVDYVVATKTSPYNTTARDESNVGVASPNDDSFQEHSSTSSSIAIGASLFHFRPIDFIQNNPLYAFLIIPAIALELVGYKTQ